MAAGGLVHGRGGCVRSDLRRFAGVADGALSRRPRACVLPQSIAGAMHAVSRARRRGLLAARLRAAERGGAVRRRWSARCSAQSAWPLAIAVAAMGCATLLLWILTRGCARGLAHDPTWHRFRKIMPESAPAEQIVEQPAVEAADSDAAVAARWPRPVARRRPASGAAASSRRTSRRRMSRAGRRPDALMGAAHEAAPDFDRQAAAGDFLGRRAVVIAEPDAGDEMARCSR